MMGQQESAGVQLLYSREGKTCLYAPGNLGPVKLTFLADTGCIHNLLSKSVFDRLPAAIREQLELWDTEDGSGLPIYGLVTLSGHTWNSPFSMGFLVSRTSDEGIMGKAF